MSLLEKARKQIQAGDWKAAAATCEARVRESGGDAETTYLLGLAYLNTGRAPQAAQILERLNQHVPDHADTLGALHSAWLEAGYPRRAAPPLRRLSELDPENASLRRQLASILLASELPDEAAAVCEALLETNAEDVGAWLILSAARREQGQAAAAREAAEQGARLAPEAAEPEVALGRALLAVGEPAEALRVLERAARRAGPRNPATRAEAIDNIGITLARAGRLNDALDIYQRLEKELPNHPESRLNHGRVLFEAGQADQALPRLAAAINLRPGSIRTRVQVAEILLEQDRIADARGHLEHVLDERPTIDLLCTLGAVELKERQLGAAIEYFDQALAINPDHPGALFGYLSAAQRACYWAVFDERLQHYLTLFRQNTSWLASSWGFINLPGTTAQDHLENANRQARQLTKGPKASKSEKSEKIRVGLLTCDFHAHPMARLVVELLETLDRQAFEWQLFYWGPMIDDPLQQRLFDSMDQTHHIHQMNDQQAAAGIRDAGIDVLVDLMGYTTNARPRITAARPAPARINWLGHAQTMGEGMADFIILDQTVCPEGEEAHFAEQVLRMPHSYFPTPREQAYTPAGSRTDHGLPEEGVVFGCFNHSLKITPETFKLWLRILQDVPDSVLWLLEDNPEATENLRQTAKARGIDPSRLIFAPRVPHDQHLGRLPHMDLMLDTLSYNGHTTTSDALVRHVPVITRPGETFPSRVSASLLKACELDQLICADNDQYVQLAIALGIDQDRLTRLKQHLTDKHDQLPLFDSQGFARSFEQLLESALAQVN